MVVAGVGDGMRKARKANRYGGVKSAINGSTFYMYMYCTYREHYHESLITDDVTANHIAPPVRDQPDKEHKVRLGTRSRDKEYASRIRDRRQTKDLQVSRLLRSSAKKHGNF